MPKKSQSALDLSKKVDRCLKSLSAGKRNYKRADAIMDELAQELEPGQIIELPNGQKKRFVDDWQGKNRVNGGMNIRRWQFEDVIET